MIKNVKTIMTWLVSSPSDFRNNWKMELYNQVGHCFLGVLFTTVAASWFYFLYDEYPEKELLWPFCIGIYLIVIELFLQKWSGLDTLVDVIFFSFGVSSIVYGLDEKIIQEQVVLQPNFEVLSANIVLFGLTLLIHILKRLCNERSSG